MNAEIQRIARRNKKAFLSDQCKEIEENNRMRKTRDLFKKIRATKGGSDGKSVCLQCGRPGCDPWVRKIPWRRKWQPTPVLLPGKFHGWWYLVGYNPWGLKESDTIELLHFTRKNR